jgi:hypothetical protein
MEAVDLQQLHLEKGWIPGTSRLNIVSSSGRAASKFYVTVPNRVSGC